VAFRQPDTIRKQLITSIWPVNRPERNLGQTKS
jgi:hypothetical protein